MISLRPTIAFLAGALLLAPLAGAQDAEKERLEREVRNLRRQVTNLNKSLTVALQEKEDRAKSLKEIKEHLALFGKDFFTDGEERLRHAVSDYQVAREKLNTIEASGDALMISISEYLRTAVAADPQARAEVELKIREFQVALGHRDKPERRIEQGTVSEARVMTVDSDSGVLVINAGQKAQIRPGMRYRIERAGQPIGDAIVAVTRPDVSGLLMQQLTDPDVVVRSGDAAHVILKD